MADNKIKNTHLVMILDQSGSMIHCRKEIIEGLNEQVSVLSRAASERQLDKDTFITIVAFNDKTNFIRFAQALDEFDEIAEHEYIPEYMTGMLDAVGSTLSKLEREVPDTPEANYLVVIVTDGQENASKEYSYTHIAKMLQNRMDTGRWTFAYLGANHDLSKISSRLGIPKSNMASYKPDPNGTKSSLEILSKLTVDYIHACSAGESTTVGFFNKDDEIIFLNADGTK